MGANAFALLQPSEPLAQFSSMSTLTKTKRPARSVRKTPVSSGPVFRKDLPPITPDSPLYGADDFIGCVSIGQPSDKDSRRQKIRARIHADNHNS